MEKFKYSALDEAGLQVTGVEEAASSGAAHLALLERGYQPTRGDAKKKSFLQFEITKKKVPRKELMHFSRQLGVFVKAGIPIMEALEVIAEETTNKLLRSALYDMIERLRAGDTSRPPPLHTPSIPELLPRNPCIGRIDWNPRRRA